MNDLEKYFRGNSGNLINKWQHYFEIYDRHFSRFRGTSVNVVEIGVGQGGSLQMWKDYFGAQAKIVGVDFNAHCKELEEAQIEIVIGDQDDRAFLKSLAARIPRIDILIDDGGHTMQQQIGTFEELFPHIDSTGVYLCEDLHTSYWAAWGGGYRNPGTFIEFSKHLIDKLHGWHSTDGSQFGVSDFTRTTHSLHYYDSVLVIEKALREKPSNVHTGNTRFVTTAPRQFPQVE